MSIRRSSQKNISYQAKQGKNSQPAKVPAGLKLFIEAIKTKARQFNASSSPAEKFLGSTHPSAKLSRKDFEPSQDIHDFIKKFCSGHEDLLEKMTQASPACERAFQESYNDTIILSPMGDAQNQVKKARKDLERAIDALSNKTLKEELRQELTHYREKLQDIREKQIPYNVFCSIHKEVLGKKAMIAYEKLCLSFHMFKSRLLPAISQDKKLDRLSLFDLVGVYQQRMNLEFQDLEPDKEEHLLKHQAIKDACSNLESKIKKLNKKDLLDDIKKINQSFLHFYERYETYTNTGSFPESAKHFNQILITKRVGSGFATPDDIRAMFTLPSLPSYDEAKSLAKPPRYEEDAPNYQEVLREQNKDIYTKAEKFLKKNINYIPKSEQKNHTEILKLSDEKGKRLPRFEELQRLMQVIDKKEAWEKIPSRLPDSMTKQMEHIRENFRENIKGLLGKDYNDAQKWQEDFIKIKIMADDIVQLYQKIELNTKQRPPIGTSFLFTKDGQRKR